MDRVSEALPALARMYEPGTRAFMTCAALKAMGLGHAASTSHMAALVPGLAASLSYLHWCLEPESSASRRERIAKRVMTQAAPTSV